MRFSIPFDYAISKNHIWAATKRGHVYLRQEHRAYRDSVILLTRDILKNQEIKNNRVWLDILVQKPDHRGDAINVLDGVCDALKEAIGLDDRWFCIRRLDWEVVKQDPQLYIGIGQERVEDCQICSYCGRLLPFTDFSKNKNTRNGVARACRECVSAAAKALKSKKNSSA